MNTADHTVAIKKAIQGSLETIEPVTGDVAELPFCTMDVSNSYQYAIIARPFRFLKSLQGRRIKNVTVVDEDCGTGSVSLRVELE